MNNEVETVVAVLGNAPSVGEQVLETQVTDIELRAGELVVASDSDYAEAGSFGRLLREKMAEVTEFFAPMKKSAHMAHKQICDREKAMLVPLQKAEGILKKSMGEYAMKKEHERKAAEEALRRLAQEEANRKLAESIEAESNGNTEVAKAALLDAEIAEMAASSIVIDGDKPRAAGVSSSVDWEIESIDESVVPVGISGVTIRPVDRTAVMKLIRASKGTIEINGIKYKAVTKVAFRR